MSRLLGREGHPFRNQIKSDDEDSTGNDMTMDPQNSVDGTQQQYDVSGTKVEIEPNSAFDIEAKPSGNEPTPPNGGLVLGGGQTIKLMLVPDKAPAPVPPPKKKEKPHPQTKMTKFWANFDPEYVGKVTRVLPERMTDRNLSLAQLVGEIAHRATNSYENAKENCIRDVKRIIKECREANQKYTDSHFDIERDLKITRGRDCLDGLVVDPNDKEYPADVKRVTVSSDPGTSDPCTHNMSRTYLMNPSFTLTACRTTTSCKARLGESRDHS